MKLQTIKASSIKDKVSVCSVQIITNICINFHNLVKSKLIL